MFLQLANLLIIANYFDWSCMSITASATLEIHHLVRGSIKEMMGSFNAGFYRLLPHVDKQLCSPAEGPFFHPLLFDLQK